MNRPRTKIVRGKQGSQWFEKLTYERRLRFFLGVPLRAWRLMVIHRNWKFNNLHVTAQ